eukprot:Nk52_evm8s296 gene=Nk52_evmTU8s296
MVKIDLDSPRYDQSTYYGRVRHFMDVTDVRNIFSTPNQLKNAVKLIDDYKQGKANDVPEEALWKAKKLRDSSIHPDTGEAIFLPFRMACFVPTNMLVTAGLLIPGPSLGQLVFWQWANQSINVAFNWANANKTTEMSLNETGAAYAGAVGTSCLLGGGLNALVARAKNVTPAVKMAAKFIPFVAVASAGVVNVFLMRQKELREGIAIQDSEGNERGKSKIAGFNALSQVAASRVCISTPALTIPPIIGTFLERRFSLSPRAMVFVNVTTVSLMLMTALPFAIGLFPQKATIAATALEPEFQNLRDSQGRPVEYFNFNKGL